MIYEVDQALREMVRRAEPMPGVDVVFDAPTKEWSARRNAPTVNVYLYDIREDLRRRQRGLLNQYDEQKVVVARHLPPRYVKLSYLISAWTRRPEEEHEALARLLRYFFGRESVPPDLLDGPLGRLGLPVPVTIALPPPEDRSFADVWTALGGELKPSLDVVVSVPVDTGRSFEAERPAGDGLAVDLASRDGEQRDARRRRHVPPPERTAMTRTRGGPS